MEKILEIQKNVKAIVRKYENNLIKLNVEVFRSVDGYDHYAVSSFGRVKNTKTGRILKTGLTGNGYFIVMLYEDRVKKTHKIHRLVANAFINNPDDKQIYVLQQQKKIVKIENLVLEIHPATKAFISKKVIKNGAQELR